MPTDNIDSKYLKDTVADVLVRACSECAVARPKDPVDYVAGWLARYVENDSILKKHNSAKDLERTAREAEEEVRAVFSPSRRRVAARDRARCPTPRVPARSRDPVRP